MFTRGYDKYMYSSICKLTCTSRPRKWNQKNGETCHESTCPPFGMFCDHLGDRWCLMMSLMLILASVCSVEIGCGILRKGSSNEWRTILTASEGLEELPDQLKDVMLLLPGPRIFVQTDQTWVLIKATTRASCSCSVGGNHWQCYRTNYFPLQFPRHAATILPHYQGCSRAVFLSLFAFFQSSGAVLFNDVILFEHRILFGPITICGLKGHMTGRWGRLWPGVREWAEIDRLIYQQLSSFNVRLRFFPS